MVVPSEWSLGGVGEADCVSQVLVVSESIVDQCPLRSLHESKREERAGKKEKKTFRRGGKNRDDGSPEI